MNKSKNCWSVYCHTTPSGKRYIGITSRKPEKRWQNGRGYNPKLPFGKAIEKYKWENIKHEILDTNITEYEAKRLEKEYIEKYRTYIYFKDCNGYNMTLGGDGTVGWEPNDETREKISVSNKGKIPWNKGIPRDEETKKKICYYNKGKTAWNKGKPSPLKGIPKSDETKIRISESKKGKHHSEETCKKISYSLKGHTPWNIGIPQSEDSKRKNSESHKGKTPWNSGKKTGIPPGNKGKHLVIIDGKRHYE